MHGVPAQKEYAQPVKVKQLASKSVVLDRIFDVALLLHRDKTCTRYYYYFCYYYHYCYYYYDDDEQTGRIEGRMDGKLMNG